MEFGSTDYTGGFPKRILYIGNRKNYRPRFYKLCGYTGSYGYYELLWKEKIGDKVALRKDSVFDIKMFRIL